MARRIRSGAVDGGYTHSGVYRKVLREACRAHVFESGAGLAEPDAERRVCPDPRMRLAPRCVEFKDGDRWVEELFAERLAAGGPITASWIHVVRSSTLVADDGIINGVRDSVPHAMLGDRKGRFRVTVDDVITVAGEDDPPPEKEPTTPAPPNPDLLLGTDEQRAEYFRLAQALRVYG